MECITYSVVQLCANRRLKSDINKYKKPKMHGTDSVAVQDKLLICALKIQHGICKLMLGVKSHQLFSEATLCRKVSQLQLNARYRCM